MTNKILYRDAIRWIAREEPTLDLAGFETACRMVAELFGREIVEVTRLVIEEQSRNAARLRLHVVHKPEGPCRG